MLPTVANLFAARPPGETGEQFVALLHTPGFRLEQIVSHGQASPPGHWYDQPEPEWVLLARGAATLEFDGGATLALAAGDCLLIPARLRHRVAGCSDDAVWLGLHFRSTD